MDVKVNMKNSKEERKPDYFIWNSKAAWSQHPEGAKWLEEVVMPSYDLPKYDRRIPLCIIDTFERATPGCCQEVGDA